ncbi:2-isopropylmalate synthase/homocitrate synthase family protein [Synechococcus sp. PCC 7335]|uniref:citramalate synthase n=1 Tax=Synechococcus sp. (strain ATCC 29403 / PCC 7335) TaxID=91464 RepID=UPI00017ECECF|nr:citramalate synthase [Synechococcus sp. PCC 7335]EDX85640.1 2-isopropylmalate synthase/homocitrate synthase family protein [Synechococcus sp. PCC 7335]
MNTPRQVLIYDTTLRDGIQRHGISCTFEDKIKILNRLAQLGIPFIEGGWPGANAVDTRLFDYLKTKPLLNTQVVAFGSTRRSHQKPSEDLTLQNLLNANTQWLTIFGKSWDLHVTDALKVSLGENLAMIQDSIEFLRANGRRVIYDAEHWFDGYQANPDYALKTLEAAVLGGADWIVLCDTNGGTLPKTVEAIVDKVRTWLQINHTDLIDPPQIGIHTHNDSGSAVTSSLFAVEAGARMVHGTINGYGERCGNADLCSVIPNLQLKMDYDCLSSEQLKTLAETSRFVSEIVNLAADDHAPYVGRSAFAHKGGIHISAVERNPKTYEHIEPSAVGNARHIVVSSSSGASTVLSKAKSYGITLRKNDPATRNIINRVKELEDQGYQFEAAEASFELLLRTELNLHQPLFQLRGFEVNYNVIQSDVQCNIGARAMIKAAVKGQEVLEVAECMGPVSALDKALHKALVRFFPAVETFYLTDYKVRILNSEAGTAAKVRVLVESSNGKQRWTTIGVSVNILEASYQAVAAGIEYGLYQAAKSRSAKTSTEKLPA